MPRPGAPALVAHGGSRSPALPAPRPDPVPPVVAPPRDRFDRYSASAVEAAAQMREAALAQNPARARLLARYPPPPAPPNPSADALQRAAAIEARLAAVAPASDPLAPAPPEKPEALRRGEDAFRRVASRYPLPIRGESVASRIHAAVDRADRDGVIDAGQADEARAWMRAYGLDSPSGAARAARVYHRARDLARADGTLREPPLTAGLLREAERVRAGLDTLDARAHQAAVALAEAVHARYPRGGLVLERAHAMTPEDAARAFASLPRGQGALAGAGPPRPGTDADALQRIADLGTEFAEARRRYARAVERAAEILDLPPGAGSAEVGVHLAALRARASRTHVGEAVAEYRIGPGGARVEHRRPIDCFTCGDAREEGRRSTHADGTPIQREGRVVPGAARDYMVCKDCHAVNGPVSVPALARAAREVAHEARAIRHAPDRDHDMRLRWAALADSVVRREAERARAWALEIDGAERGRESRTASEILDARLEALDPRGLHEDRAETLLADAEGAGRGWEARAEARWFELHFAGYPDMEEEVAPVLPEERAARAAERDANFARARARITGVEDPALREALVSRAALRHDLASQRNLREAFDRTRHIDRPTARARARAALLDQLDGPDTRARTRHLAEARGYANPSLTPAELERARADRLRILTHQWNPREAGDPFTPVDLERMGPPDVPFQNLDASEARLGTHQRMLGDVLARRGGSLAEFERETGPVHPERRVIASVPELKPWERAARDVAIAREWSEAGRASMERVGAALDDYVAEVGRLGDAEHMAFPDELGEALRAESLRAAGVTPAEVSAADRAYGKEAIALLRGAPVALTEEEARARWRVETATGGAREALEARVTLHDQSHRTPAPPADPGAALADALGQVDAHVGLRAEMWSARSDADRMRHALASLSDSQRTLRIARDGVVERVRAHYADPAPVLRVLEGADDARLRALAAGLGRDPDALRALSPRKPDDTSLGAVGARATAVAIEDFATARDARRQALEWAGREVGLDGADPERIGEAARSRLGAADRSGRELAERMQRLGPVPSPVEIERLFSALDTPSRGDALATLPRLRPMLEKVPAPTRAPRLSAV